jgi:hypothetical protein
MVLDIGYWVFNFTYPKKLEYEKIIVTIQHKKLNRRGAKNAKVFSLRPLR